MKCMVAVVAGMVAAPEGRAIVCVTAPSVPDCVQKAQDLPSLQGTLATIRCDCV